MPVPAWRVTFAVKTFFARRATRTQIRVFSGHRESTGAVSRALAACHHCGILLALLARWLRSNRRSCIREFRDFILLHGGCVVQIRRVAGVVHQ